MLNIIYHQILIEAHWSIEKIEKYHIHIHCVDNIIQAETKCIISKNGMLQIVFKVINKIMSSDNLVTTLFVFGV